MNVFKSAAELARRGCEVVIATSRSSSETFKGENLNEKWVEGVKIRIIQTTEDLEQLIRWAGVVHIYFTFSFRPASVTALEYCTRNNQKCIFSIRTEYQHIPFSAIGDVTPLERDKHLQNLKENLAYPEVFISAPAKSIQATLKKLDISKKVHVIRNGTEFNREDLEDSQHETVDFTYIGEISFLKGVNYLLDAVRSVRADFPKLKVRLIGGGSDLQEMRRWVDFFDLKGTVVFTGYVNHNQIPGYLAATRVYIHPSLTEVWPNAVLEALALGVPVICTNAGGLPELTQDGKFAELVPIGDAVQLANAMKRILSQPESYNDLKERATHASHYIQSHYTLSQQVDQMEALYSNLL